MQMPGGQPGMMPGQPMMAQQAGGHNCAVHGAPQQPSMMQPGMQPGQQMYRPGQPMPGQPGMMGTCLVPSKR